MASLWVSSIAPPTQQTAETRAPHFAKVVCETTTTPEEPPQEHEYTERWNTVQLKVQWAKRSIVWIGRGTPLIRVVQIVYRPVASEREEFDAHQLFERVGTIRGEIFLHDSGFRAGHGDRDAIGVHDRIGE
jgi:hypothetical protein